jgi:subtilisin-like proprotein convertase family protein
VAWGDVDGDGDLDLAAGNESLWNGSQWIGGQNKVYLNVDGMLQTSAAWASGDSDRTTTVAWGDVDGDGDLDLAAGNSGSPNKVYLNVGGTLQTSAAWASGDIDYTYSVAWGDMDGDGDLDLAAGNSGSPNKNKVYLNMGGTLQTSAAWAFDDNDLTNSVAWGDVDGDGDLDLAGGNDYGPNEVYLNQGGMLQPVAIWNSGDSDWTTTVAWGDVDGDGDLDLAAGNWNGPNKVYPNVGGVLQRAADNPWTSGDNDLTNSVAWGDVDGDGDLDLVAGGSGQNRLYRNTRDARLLPGSVPTVRVAQLGPNADMYSSPQIWSGIIPITYTLSDPQGDPVEFIRAWYSPDGGGCWYTATAASGVVTTHLGTTSFVTRTVRNMTPASIPDLSAITSALTLTPTDMIADLDVTLNLTHTFDSNLVITLTSPFSRSVRLVAGRGGSGSNFTNTVFDDEAATSVVSGSAPFSGRFRPEQTLAHFDGYSPQGLWTLAIADVAGGDSGRLLSWGITAILNSGKVYTYAWDVDGSGFFGQSDNVVFRIQEIPAVVTGMRNVTPGPYLYGAYASQTFPFRVRGTQVRVVSGTLPISNALVYRLPASQVEGGQPLADAAGRPFRTDGQGYLQGRGQIGLGDRLLALTPITRTESYTLYYTNATPTPTGLDAYTVSEAGVQTLTISSAHPLLLFDLDVSLEWDAHDDPGYLQQLATDLQKASAFLYDFTNGQAALGHVTVHQNADAWLTSDVVVYATNRLRPLAIQGGVVLTPTLDPDHADIVYDTGQVRMGATWNRYGDPVEDMRLDWQLALAHELAHYLLFQEDTYLGLNADGLLIPLRTCAGSAMGDVYDDRNTEFLDDSGWGAGCAASLAHVTLGRSEWATVRTWYPHLFGIDQSGANAGPSSMPFELTTVRILDPLTPTHALVDPTFFVDYLDGASSSSEARAFLLRQEAGGQYVQDLGSPVSGQDRVLARGARPGDRLCVFDQPRRQYGCKTVAVNETYHLGMNQDTNWTPLVQVSPVTSQTIAIAVGGLSPGLTLRACLYPEYGFGSDPITLAYTDGVYGGTFANLPYPAVAGHVQVWAGDSQDTWRQVVVAYTIGGNPGENPFSRGHGPFSRGHGPFSRGHGPFYRGHGAFAVSPDGQMSLFTPDPDFAPGEMYTIQATAALPPLPPGKLALGSGYRLVSSATPLTSGATISFQYLGLDALKERVDEEGLTIHFWDGTPWRALDTVVDSYYNMASARSQGDGVYALLAGIATPAISAVTPSAATNDLATTLVISGSHFLAPVEVTLVSPTTGYSLPVVAVSPLSVTAVISAGLPAREYQVVVHNRLDGTASNPATFALFAPAPPNTCFYDFFESGASRWQRSGDWGIVTIVPGGERAMTDSPLGPYKSAGDYGSGIVTYTTAITSQAFNLSACTSPTLTFRHDCILAKVGSSQDIARVEISTDGGTTWTELARYSGGGIYGEGLGTQDVEAPEWADVNWKQVEISLSGYTGMARLRFSLEVDQNASDKGWVVDDVMVKGEVGPSNQQHSVYLPIVLK